MKNKDRKLWEFISSTTEHYARIFSLPLWKVRPGFRKWKGKFQGSCSKRGLVRIALRNRFGERFEAYAYVDTIAHELAHLRFFHHHKNWFWLHVNILSQMEADGIYEKMRKARKEK